MCKSFLRSIIDLKLNWYHGLISVMKWEKTYPVNYVLIVGSGREVYGVHFCLI